MKTAKSLLVTLFLATAFTGLAEVPYVLGPADGPLMTRWAKDVPYTDDKKPHPEYPRPLMQRDQWLNLNGPWMLSAVNVGTDPTSPVIEVEVTDGTATSPEVKEQSLLNGWVKPILVPFAVESALSGVGERIGPDKALQYNRGFEIPAAWKGQRIMLNFGAVDWRADVWVNDIKVGRHEGGYTPWSLDITDAIDPSKDQQDLTVLVWDPTDKGPQPIGKQLTRNRGIWYTPVSGIWQTVWLEPVPTTAITKVKTTPRLGDNAFVIEIATSSPQSRGYKTVAVAKDRATGAKVARAMSINGEPLTLILNNPRLWSPDEPNLYDFDISLIGPDGKVIDKVRSYGAMREYGTARDQAGHMRLTLNGKPIFQFGPLDQGWWPDGLYTAPTYEAMISDLVTTKDLGYNMIRKHVKVEPATWYTACDSLGIIVWQDMPSGDNHGLNDGNPAWYMTSWFPGPDRVRCPESEAIYLKEWNDVMDYLYSNPCIGMWVPFNEAWGQFDTREIAEWTKAKDPTRPVNAASGGNFFHGVGDVLDMHNYPEPKTHIYDGNMVNVQGEFGGIGRPIKGHLWTDEKNWGYVTLPDEKAVTDKYVDVVGMLLDMVSKGISAGVYTQTSDVEVEVNGLLTYDRDKLKFDAPRLRKINKALVHSLDNLTLQQ